jgi:fatty-acyl-CoA synthase
VILTDDHFEEVASSAANGLGIKVVSADEPNLSGATAHLADHLDSSVTDLETRAETEAAALIMYTSGTTGKPKGVTFSHGNVMYEAMLKGLSRSSEDRGLDFFPLHHFNGGFGQIVPVINNAGSVVFQSDFDPVDFGSQLNKHGITHAAVNSNHVYALLEQPPNSKDQDHECRFMTLGLKLDANTHRAFEARYRTRLLGVYGLTEAVGPFIRESHEYVTSPHSSGRPLPGYEVAVLDEQGERLPPGSQGEVVVRSQSRHGFFLGYWNDPERTKQTLSDEWMRTGDMGYVEPDGRFVYLQRIADMARRGGHRVAPFQTEEVMFEHPAVQEVAVIGLADDPDHETLVSILILHDSDGNREETLAEIKSMCAERVQPSLVPDHILTSQRFPKDILGKLDRKRLRQEIKDRLTAQK